MTTGVCPLATRDLVGKVLLFCERVNGIDLYAYQRAIAFRVIESLLNNDGDVVTALLARQSGKSEVLASVALGLAILLPKLAAVFPGDPRLTPFRKGVFIGVFAPKLELSGPIYEKVRDRAASDHVTAILADPEIDVQVVQSRGDSLAFSHGSFVKAQTASEQTLVEGKTFHLVFIDEAQKVSRYKVNKEISPMLAATNGTMVKIGTAWMSRGGFHHDIQMNLDTERQGGVRNHFEFNYEQVLAEKKATYERQEKAFKAGRRAEPADAFHLLYARWIEKEIRRLGGVNGEEFKMNFRLLWQESRQIAISETTLRSAAVPTREMNIPKFTGVQFAGLDVAKEHDSTVLTVIELDIAHPIVDADAKVIAGETPTAYYRKDVLGWCELQGSFEGHQYQRICEFLDLYNVQLMYVDSTGMGDPVCERLQVLLGGSMQVEPFRLTMASNSDMYKYLLQEIGAQRVRYPAGPNTAESIEYEKFIFQLLGLGREWHGSYLVCQAEEGDHDDFADSLALATWASRHVDTVMPLVDVEVNPLYRSARGHVAEQPAGMGRSSRYRRGRR